MDELKFVIKGLIFTVLLTMLMQVKVGHTTIEEKADGWLRSSTVASFLQKVSSGAIKITQKVRQTSSQFFSKAFGNNQQIENRASRLNFELKRSPQAVPSQNNEEEY